MFGQDVRARVGMRNGQALLKRDVLIIDSKKKLLSKIFKKTIVVIIQITFWLNCLDQSQVKSRHFKKRGNKDRFCMWEFCIYLLILNGIREDFGCKPQGLALDHYFEVNDDDESRGRYFDQNTVFLICLDLFWIYIRDVKNIKKNNSVALKDFSMLMGLYGACIILVNKWKAFWLFKYLSSVDIRFRGVDVDRPSKQNRPSGRTWEAGCRKKLRN
jgi:hypothetical protein